MEAVTIDDLLEDADRVGIEVVGADAIGVEVELRLNGSRFVDCRFSGADFANSALTDVTFHSCILSAASFRFARMLRVKFEDCRLDETEFSHAKLRDVVIAGCHVEATEFSNAEIKSADLRSSQVISVRGVTSMTNATISSLQANALGPQLAQSLGLKVQDEFVVVIDPAEKFATAADDDEEDEVVLPPDEALAHVAELRKSLKPS